MQLKENVRKLIDTKAEEMNDFADIILNEISSYIKQLNLYIDGTIELSSSEIERKLDCLVVYMTITLELPYDKDLDFLRAVKYNEKINEKVPPCYDKVSRLSYIPKNSNITPSLGRLNKENESMYYACIYFDDKFGGKNVAFAEINALEEDRINILISKSTKKIKLNYIGMLDNVFRETKPYYIKDSIYTYYKIMYDYMKNKFNKKLFTAFLLTDAFFADILSRKNRGRLYEVTSILASIYLKGDRSDGIVYSSVQAKGSPVVVLKTEVVDEKVEHIKTECFHIIKDYGYAKYYAKKLYEGTIDNNTISWKKCTEE